MKIGFIGTGIMGRPMAGHLQAAGHELFLLQHRSPLPEELVSGGAIACKSAREVAERAEVVILMLPDTPDVEKVLFAEEGVAQGLQRGAAVLDMSSISPTATADFAKRILAQGGEYLDAPVSGGEVGAKNQTLTIMCGGARATFDRLLPLPVRLLELVMGEPAEELLLADQPAADWRDVPGDARGDEAARLLAVTGEAAARVAACRGATEVPRPHETTGPRLPARPTPDHPGEWARATFANPAFVLRHAHAHARTAHERWAADLGLRRLGGGRAHTAAEVAALTEPAAEAVLGALFDGPAALRAAARRHQPHILVRYLEGLAAAYHDWWESHDVLSGRADAADDRAGTAAARLDVCAAVAGVLHAGLSLIGVSAPTRL